MHPDEGRSPGELRTSRPTRPTRPTRPAPEHRRRVVAALAVTLLALVGLASPALAAFVNQASATSTFSSATLQPPTGLTASAGCTASVPNVTLTWTPTPSTWADGYELDRALSSMGPWTTTAIAGASTSSHRVEGLQAATTYYFRLRAVRLAWTSAYTPTVSVVTRLVNLGGLCI